ncbi:MAG: divalent-cation tolerance protein CutA [Acidimicrobiia bacterium]
MSDHALVLATCGDRKEADAIARRLVSDGLAAGVQIVTVASVYTWKGEVVDDDEFLLICKTRTGLYDRVQAAIASMHSYEVPPILMLPIEQASEGYLAWIDEVTE